jgi:hypothetical protein
MELAVAVQPFFNVYFANTWARQWSGSARCFPRGRRHVALPLRLLCAGFRRLTAVMAMQGATGLVGWFRSGPAGYWGAAFCYVAYVLYT